MYPEYLNGSGILKNKSLKSVLLKIGFLTCFFKM